MECIGGMRRCFCKLKYGDIGRQRRALGATSTSNHCEDYPENRVFFFFYWDKDSISHEYYHNDILFTRVMFYSLWSLQEFDVEANGRRMDLLFKFIFFTTRQLLTGCKVTSAGLLS